MPGRDFHSQRKTSNFDLWAPVPATLKQKAGQPTSEPLASLKKRPEEIRSLDHGKSTGTPVVRVLPGLQGLHEATRRNLSEMMMVKVMVVVMMGVLAMIMMVTVVAIANDNDGDSCGRDHAHNDNDNDHDGKMLSYGNVSKAFSIVFTQPQSASPLSR